MQIIKQTDNNSYEGCNFVVQLPAERKETSVRILQITDMQIIDASQRRTPERLNVHEIEAWKPENFDLQCGNHIRSLVAQSRPDLIIITGDIVYGSFDDSGRVFEYICSLMDSFEIPWAPVFGNHDNESSVGVAWQCERFERCRYCLFERGTVSGNGNYTVGIAIGKELVRVIHMLDSNGCGDSDDPAIIRSRGLFPDQLELIRDNTKRIQKAQNKAVPAFVAFHIPVDCFQKAEETKGYRKHEEDRYVLGVNVPAKDDDFGFCLETYYPIPTEPGFVDYLRAQNVDGVFVGHVHNSCISITYEGIRWTMGLKTGQYDYHIPYQIGGTLITLNGHSFTVNHIPSLVPCVSMPGNAPMFSSLFVQHE